MVAVRKAIQKPAPLKQIRNTSEFTIYKLPNTR